MDLFVFIAGAFVVTVYMLWRSRRGGSRGPETLNKGLPDDLRDKSTGMIGQANHGRPWGRGN